MPSPRRPAFFRTWCALVTGVASPNIPMAALPSPTAGADQLCPPLGSFAYSKWRGSSASLFCLFRRNNRKIFSEIYKKIRPQLLTHFQGYAIILTCVGSILRILLCTNGRDLRGGHTQPASKSHRPAANAKGCGQKGWQRGSIWRVTPTRR